jgi:hypothetical protein
MNLALQSLALVAASLASFYGMARIVFSKGALADSQSLDFMFGLAVLILPLLLPIVGFRILRGQRRSLLYKLLLFPAFVFSLLPAVVLLCLLLVVLFVPRPS